LGTGGVRVLLSPQPVAERRSSGSASREDWPSPLGSESSRVAHLLRRATFGVTSAELEAALQEGFDGTVERLIETPAQEPSPLISPADPTLGHDLEGDELQKWWVRHLLSTSTPFAERMTLLWHGHFTSDLEKASVLFMYWQNLTWRRMALGKLDAMLREVTLDPAMLLYLDLADSNASDPAQPPNENYARELMELFTMGPGNYREGDVKAAAKALAGWTTPPPDGQVEVVVDQATGARESVDVWYEQRPGVFAPDAAYTGEVSYLGKRGRLQLDDIVDQIVQQPATARFLARKVATQFISNRPDDRTVSEIAESFSRSGYDVKTLMRAAFMSPEFSAPASYRSLVKSPVDFMVSAARALRIAPEDGAELVVGFGDATGQSLFQPPNVAGWPPNGAWISPGMLLARFNFVGQLLDAAPELPAAGEAAQLHLDGVLGEATGRRLAGAASDRERWLVVLTSPEFNLK
jgi:uncharacterized protein (DUF1800 family)